ncbi:hypothetical protein K1719_026404 [Acacia pycnantha]|nr:hypothetical protein K1719_026404 [Acacia pycnantha]
MDVLYAASLHSFFNNEDSNSTFRCPPHSIRRICIFILYMKLQLTHATTPSDLTISVRGGVNAGYAGGGPPHSRERSQNRPNTALFFLENDLKSGHKMNVLFTKSSNQASFLPHDVVKSIPFSSTKMTEILNNFAVKPGSIKAEVIKNTIKVCEESAIKGEDKYCATSLESMLDFITSKLGKDVEALSTKVMMKKETKKQEYTITNRVKKVGETKVVVCHKLNYVYAVFYCHKIEKTVAYTVLLEGADGSSVKAVSVCHRDTSAWRLKHLAFQMLNVKPGSVPICHFLFQDSITWVPKQN